MDYNEFDKLLGLAKLGKAEFAEINQLNKNSVFNWKQKGVPGWVQPWLEHYIKSKAFDAVLDTAEQLRKEIE